MDRAKDKEGQGLVRTGQKTDKDRGKKTGDIKAREKKDKGRGQEG